MLLFPGCGRRPSQEIILSAEAEELIQRGINSHDQGDYEAALGYFKRAMELAPDHPEILYQLGFTYFSMGDLTATLEMIDKGLANAKAWSYNGIIPPLLDLKGSVLNSLGRNVEAIDVYLMAINEYGASGVLIYYNLGVSYYRASMWNEAEEALITGLLLNPNHADSHYLLGRGNIENGRSTQAFYALCFFLLLEPHTDRSALAYSTIVHMLSNRDETIGIRDNGTFTPADIIISVAFTLDEYNFRLSEAEKTQAKLYYIFTNLEERLYSGGIERSAGDELYWDFYAPLFSRIAGSQYFDTFSRYIALTADPDADDWVDNHETDIEVFFFWLNSHL